MQVRFVQADAIQRQLNGGHIVLLGNLAYSAAGEVLNCDCYSVATQAAIDLQADKLFCLTTPDLQPFDLPHWLPISDAERLLTSLMQSRDGDQTEQSSGVFLLCPLRCRLSMPVAGASCHMCLSQAGQYQ